MLRIREFSTRFAAASLVGLAAVGGCGGVRWLDCDNPRGCMVVNDRKMVNVVDSALVIYTDYEYHVDGIEMQIPSQTICGDKGTIAPGDRSSRCAFVANEEMQYNLLSTFSGLPDLPPAPFDLPFVGQFIDCKDYVTDPEWVAPDRIEQDEYDVFGRIEVRERNDHQWEAAVDVGDAKDRVRVQATVQLEVCRVGPDGSNGPF